MSAVVLEQSCQTLACCSIANPNPAKRFVKDFFGTAGIDPDVVHLAIVISNTGSNVGIYA